MVRFLGSLVFGCAAVLLPFQTHAACSVFAPHALVNAYQNPSKTLADGIIGLSITSLIYLQRTGRLPPSIQKDIVFFLPTGSRFQADLDRFKSEALSIADTLRMAKYYARIRAQASYLIHELDLDLTDQKIRTGAEEVSDGRSEILSDLIQKSKRDDLDPKGLLEEMRKRKGYTLQFRVKRPVTTFKGDCEGELAILGTDFTLEKIEITAIEAVEIYDADLFEKTFVEEPFR